MKQIRASKTGVNALTETNPNEFIFHSAYNTFKIIAEGTYSPTLADSGGSELSVNVAHGLSYTPFVFPFCKFANSRVGIVGDEAGGAFSGFWFSNFKVDATNMVFYYLNSSGGDYTPVFKYIITEVPL